MDILCPTMDELIPLKVETFGYDVVKRTFINEGSLVTPEEPGQVRQVSLVPPDALPYQLLDLTIREMLYQLSPCRKILRP